MTERDSFKLFKLTQSGTKTQIGTVPNVVTTSGEGGLLARSRSEERVRARSSAAPIKT
ncbi:hypothetical protein ACFV2H_50700 [Streptomyces sp. NPDC059629]|uniref:hypothetical protein n=1 Tax=Streptomyces sp. NPDC059629 TaxID=3346889 RepID=UPI0036868195